MERILIAISLFVLWLVYLILLPYIEEAVRLFIEQGKSTDRKR